MSNRDRHRGLLLRGGPRPLWQDAPGSPIWHVPSESDTGRDYIVNLLRVTCECERWKKKGGSCKHIWAARLENTVVRGINPESVPNPHKNPPYYDAVKRNEEASVRELLRCLAERIPQRGNRAN